MSSAFFSCHDSRITTPVSPRGIIAQHHAWQLAREAFGATLAENSAINGRRISSRTIPTSPAWAPVLFFHAIQILMGPWFPMCWACVCDILVPGAVELLPSSARASRLLGWGAIGAEQGRKQVAPKTNGLSWVPDSQTPVAVRQSPVSHNNGLPSAPRGSVEVGRPTADAQCSVLSARCSLLSAYSPLPKRPRACVLTLALPAGLAVPLPGGRELD